MQAEAGADLAALLAAGGASRNNRLMQFQAAIIGRPLLRSTSAEASPLGAAYLAMDALRHIRVSVSYSWTAVVVTPMA